MAEEVSLKQTNTLDSRRLRCRDAVRQWEWRRELQTRRQASERVGDHSGTMCGTLSDRIRLM
jgi:hypothetical protein